MLAATAPSQTTSLSADFLPAIANPAASIFLGHIRQVRSAPNLTQSGFTYHVGTLVLDVQDSITNSPPRRGATFETPFRQVADPMIRFRNLRDQWNNLTLVEGQLLLLASIPSNTSTPHLIAAADLKSPDDPKLRALRLAYAIEQAPSQEKPRLLAQALQSNDSTAWSYALDAVGERGVIGKDAGLRLLTDTLTSPTTPQENRLAISYHLANLFNEHLAPQSQATVIAALASAMLYESNKESQATYASYLRACILGDLNENPAHRDTILRTIHNPPSAQVVQALSALAHDPHAEPDVQERESLAKLAHVWQHASELKP